MAILAPDGTPARPAKKLLTPSWMITEAVRRIRQELQIARACRLAELRRSCGADERDDIVSIRIPRAHPFDTTAERKSLL